MARDSDGFVRQLRSIYLKAAPKNRKNIRPWVERLLEVVRSFKDLVALLEDRARDKELRLFACRAVWVMRERRGVPALVRTLKDDEDMTVVNEAAVGLDTLRSKAAVPKLIEALKSGKGVGNRVSAAWTLGNLHAKAATPALLKVLANQEEDPKVRAEAAEALGLISDRRAVEPLIRALEDPSAEVRFWATYGLGRIGDLRAVSHLERLTGDDTVIPEWWSIGKEATEAIESIREIAGWRKPGRKAARPSARRTKRPGKPTTRRREGKAR